MNVRNNPVLFLRWYLQASQRADRAQIGWEEDDLARAAKSWGMATIAAAGNPRLHEQVCHEHGRFVALRKQLLDGAIKAGFDGAAAWGYLVMEEHDWAPPQVTRAALRALDHAEIRVFA